MMEAVGNIAGIAVMSFVHIYSWHQLEEKQINYKDPKFYVSLLLGIVLLLTGVLFVNKSLRIACITIAFMLVNYYLMRKNIKSTILMPVFTEIIIMLSETALALLLSFLRVDVNSIVTHDRFGGFAINAAVSVIAILIVISSKFLPKLYQRILKETDKLNSEYFVAFSFVIIFTANILAMTVYYKIDFKYLLLFNTLITIIYFIIIIHSLSNKNNYLKVSDKYNTTLSSLKEYEDILNKYRVSNHENKNQLLTIRNMIKNNEKNIPEYIDTLVENKLKDNENLMGQSMVIPEGGLRGLVYSKMLLMKEKNIDFDLSIDKAIRTVELIQLGDQTVWDICTIIGVFLDNAIEAVENLEEKFIDLEMSIEGKKLYISVTNNFKGTIDLEHMEEKGFTTKGKGHGYGLSLVKDLVEKNRLLQNEKMIRHDEFIQRLVVNISKIK